ncbi:hypothetical protein HID58_034059, partial [Brassica napus]
NWMNLYKHSQLISFINRRKNPYAVKRQMTNYMLQDDEKHQKFNLIFLINLSSFYFFLIMSSGGGSGSLQSTLWSRFTSGYSLPVGPSREPSLPRWRQNLYDLFKLTGAHFQQIRKEKDKQ